MISIEIKHTFEIEVSGESTPTSRDGTDKIRTSLPPPLTNTSYCGAHDVRVISCGDGSRRIDPRNVRATQGVPSVYQTPAEVELQSKPL